MRNEKYFLEKPNNISLNFSKFVDLVYKRHLKDYGETGATNIKKRATEIFKKCLLQLSDNSKNNNVLLVGKVQSGKTSNLEMLTAIGFDNDFRCVIIYGGYDKKLLAQTRNRFKKTFSVQDEDIDNENPILITSEDHIDDSLMEMIINKNRPIIIVVMKRPDALRKINKIINIIPKKQLKSFIIDDEGDQAGLNTKIRKKEQSSTYKEIVDMKDKLLDPLYISVTATPHANILVNRYYSRLKPDSVYLINPGKGYTGAEFFHLTEEKIIPIKDSDLEKLEYGQIPKSLYDAFYYFILASAIMIKKGIKKSDMIIHTSRKKTDHKKIYDVIYEELETLKDLYKNSYSNLKIRMNKIEKIFTEEYFDKYILKSISLSELKPLIKDVIFNCTAVLQDSNGEITQLSAKYSNHKIFIGGDLLQRGLTFKYLVTTYFTRKAKKSGNMDTTIQRARWLGYRDKYLDLCRIFTTKDIQKEYSALTESENDLWEQFESIEKGELSIEDIVIDAQSSTLNPTRKNVADYTNVKFSKKWNNQKVGIFDIQINELNNRVTDEFLSTLHFQPSSVGRTDENPSCLYAYVEFEKIINFINNTKYIFTRLPFNKQGLVKIFKTHKIVIQKMFDVNKQTKIRTRSFDKNTCEIFALQQGADKVIEEEKKYLGDSHVLVDKSAVTIQVFKIRPKIDSVPYKKYDQYMYSIHSPENRKGFIRNDKKYY